MKLVSTDGSVLERFKDLAEHLLAASELVEELVPVRADLQVEVGNDYVMVTGPYAHFGCNGNPPNASTYLSRELYDMVSKIPSG